MPQQVLCSPFLHPSASFKTLAALRSWPAAAARPESSSLLPPTELSLARSMSVPRHSAPPRSRPSREPAARPVRFKCSPQRSRFRQPVLAAPVQHKLSPSRTTGSKRFRWLPYRHRMAFNSDRQLARPHWRLEPLAPCRWRLPHHPRVSKPATSRLPVQSLATNAQVSLSGMGFDFSLSPNGQSSQTVSSGQTASFTLSLTTLGGSSGTFTFSCSSLPANSSCTFNPAERNSVSERNRQRRGTGCDRSRLNLRAEFQPCPRHPHLGTLPSAVSLIFLPLANRRRRRGTFLLAIFILSSFGLASCAGAGGGGGGTPPSTNGATPPGTYSVVVTATANGLSHKVTVTLTVD